MKFLKIGLLVIGSIIVLLAILFGIYLLINRQGIIEPSDVGEPDSEERILIASQGSKFKNTLVEELSKYLEEKQVYLKIVDVTALEDVAESDWDAVILIHTTEMNKLQPDVKAYLDRVHDYSRVILITTSGPGDWKTDEYNVDIITSASKQEELPGLTEDVIKRLDLMIRD